MDIGLGLPQTGAFACPDALRMVATAAERAGFASLWTLDRLLTPNRPGWPSGSDPVSVDGRVPTHHSIALDPMLALTAAAAVTESIRLGTGVLVAPFLPPVVLARSAASLDRLSDGRFTLGLGSGWMAEEFRATGTDRRHLQLRMEEVLEVLLAVWRDDDVEVRGSRERIDGASIGLKPVRGTRVPITLAASTPAGLERVARLADGWIPTGRQIDDVPAGWAYVQHLAERYGRDPESLRLTVRAEVRITDHVGHDRPAFTGSTADVRCDVDRMAEIGADEVVLDLQGTTSSTAELMDVATDIAGSSLPRSPQRAA